MNARSYGEPACPARPRMSLSGEQPVVSKVEPSKGSTISISMGLTVIGGLDCRLQYLGKRSNQNH